MGFRNPFRIQVDSDGVAYVTDYSPDSRAPTHLRGPAGTGRVEIVRKPSNYGWPMCYAPKLPMYLWDFNTHDLVRGAVRVRQPGRPARRTRRAGTPVCGTGRRSPSRTSGTRTTTTRPRRRARRASRTTTGPAAPARSSSRSSGPAASARTARPSTSSTRTTRARRSSRRTSTTRCSSASSRATTCVRSGSTPRAASSRSTTCSTAAPSERTGGLFECDNPMDMQFGADGNLYLLTYGDGFFVANPDAGLYRFEYVAGEQKPEGGAERHADQRRGAARGPLLERGLERSGRERLDQLRSGTSASPARTDSIDPNPSFTYTANGVYTARLTVTDAAGNIGRQDDPDHRRQHRADGDDHHPGRRRLLRLGRRHPVHGHRHRPAGRRRSTAAASP